MNLHRRTRHGTKRASGTELEVEVANTKTQQSRQYKFGERGERLCRNPVWSQDEPMQMGGRLENTPSIFGAIATDSMLSVQEWGRIGTGLSVFG
jgi:hypothetical protein